MSSQGQDRLGARFTGSANTAICSSPTARRDSGRHRPTNSSPCLQAPAALEVQEILPIFRAPAAISSRGANLQPAVKDEGAPALAELTRTPAPGNRGVGGARQRGCGEEPPETEHQAREFLIAPRDFDPVDASQRRKRFVFLNPALWIKKNYTVFS